MRLLALLSALWLSACSGGYSFTGGNFGTAKTVNIGEFPNFADIINPNLSLVFTESLRNIFLRETPLRVVDNGGDITYEGTITGYTIVAASPTANQQTAQSNLTITVNVIYHNETNPDDDFERKFTRSLPFDADQDFASIELELSSEICRLLAEDILNGSVMNW
jgi:hypothetical protein